MKAKIVVLVGLLLTLIAMSMGVIAQDTASPCAAADVLDVEHQGIIEREWIASMAITLDTTAKDDNMTDWLGAAREMRETLARVEANCRGLHFTSEDEGMKAVIGPVTFPDGVWKLAMEQDGMIATVKLTDLAGTCYDFISNVLTVSGDTAGNPAEVVVKLKGCEALIEVESVGGKGWDLMFEPIKLDE